jgi:hypothetical protein
VGFNECSIDVLLCDCFHGTAPWSEDLRGGNPCFMMALFEGLKPTPRPLGGPRSDEPALCRFRG